ncbi:GT2 family glycosyltransferase [Cytobacillus eiseniae]|uniref:GT2 family glycosyltransferase n=1 Tax=Cytobacillus eiseniae TaxID=762947 RepID=A0ABS4RI03_9BACI|nr:glycosyltransferase family 2 protein [Cytobacillus eiseniae]MBP2242344.1 GT2 family glycosyltransferase [Cytobacillus eiseniae]
MDVSIIIVNYNTKKLTLDCIRSIYDSYSYSSIEIFLVDNNSTDGSLAAIKDKYKDIIIIANSENVGFSKANNQAINLSKGRYILLLNSDTIVKNGTIDVISRFMDENKEVGATGCKVLLPDGHLDQACHRGFPTPASSFYYLVGLDKRFPNKPRYNGYHLSHLNLDEVHEVDCLVGAFMMVRRETIEQVGLLDEMYFMYGEDIDWCYRIKQAGWKIYYNPKTEIIHYKGASSRKKPYKIVYEFHRAMYLFHKRHFAKKYPFFVNLAVYAGITLKLSFASFINLVKK